MQKMLLPGERERERGRVKMSESVHRSKLKQKSKTERGIYNAYFLQPEEKVGCV